MNCYYKYLGLKHRNDYRCFTFLKWLTISLSSLLWDVGRLECCGQEKLSDIWGDQDLDGKLHSSKYLILKIMFDGLCSVSFYEIIRFHHIKRGIIR